MKGLFPKSPFTIAAGMAADSPQCQSGMEACGGGATGGSHRKHISRHRYGRRTMSGQPGEVCVGFVRGNRGRPKYSHFYNG